MKSHDAIRRKLKEFGLTYPEAHGKSPWPGHDDLDVRVQAPKKLVATLPDDPRRRAASRRPGHR